MTAPQVIVERRPDGSILLSNAEPLGRYPRVMTERLASGATECPDRVFLGERSSGQWRSITYAQAFAAVRSIGQSLLDRGLSGERPVAILSGGSIAHALLALGATHVGIPYCPVSPAYSLLAQDSSKLDHVLGLLNPGLVYVEDHEAFSGALERSAFSNFEVVAKTGLAPGVTAFDVLASTAATSRVDECHQAISPDDPRSILFTSGTTGAPKGVITTHRMTCANQQMFVQTFPEFVRTPPELLSWLPWHHTSGANSILGSVVYNHGTLWIDDGKPIEGPAMDETLRNLREIAPTAYFSAPSGLRLLGRALSNDAELRRRFYSRLSFFFYSGSAMPAPLAAEIDEISIGETGRAIPFYSCYGSTESAPFATAVNWQGATGGMVGLPMPGVELKLAPVDGLTEARIKGPTVTPGYWRNPDATSKAFDEEGYYCFGDAMAPAGDDPSRGLLFDGRIGENFKLATGTWVNVAGLRDRLLTAAKGALADVVIAGEGRDEIGALLFPDMSRSGDPARLRSEAEAALTEISAQATGSSTFVACALLMDTPPDPAAGEMTDKGAVSQRGVLRARREAVDSLFADPPPGDIIFPRK